MNSSKRLIQSLISQATLWLAPALVFSLFACSQGIRMKNLVNYPLVISNLSVLDTLKVTPEYVQYKGTKESQFRSMTQSIRIQGRHDLRPVWTSDNQGCLEVIDQAMVHILDFNFSGGQDDTTLIRVHSGTLILENCDFSSNDSWAIQVDSGAYLELRNIQFSDLRNGAIQMNGGIVKIFDSNFDSVGKTALSASQGDLLEIHGSIFRNTMGTAIDLHSVTEVWLDSTRVIDSFQDGIVMDSCDYILLNQMESRENGRNGLSLSNSKICGMMNHASLGNLVMGIDISRVDTLRILNSDILGNGETGGRIIGTKTIKLAGLRMGHNGGTGLIINQGNNLWINRSTFQANPQQGLQVDEIESILLDQISVVNNGLGMTLTRFDSLSLVNSLLSANRGKSAALSSGNQLSISKNLIKGNQSGLNIDNVLLLQLDSNRIEDNEVGSDMRSISRINMQNNTWVGNQTGAYFSQLGSLTSKQDHWLSHLSTGFEILSAKELVMSHVKLHNNRNGGLVNGASLRLESSTIDSTREIGLKLMNSNLVVGETTFENNGTAVELAQGSQARITQSHFSDNQMAIVTQPSVSLKLSFSTVTDSRNGIRVGNYGDVEILSNHFSTIDNYCIELSDPHMQGLLMRQNVIHQTGGILKSMSKSGVLDIYNNTFAQNNSGIVAPMRTLNRLDHNIFYQTTQYDFDLLKDPEVLQFNCFYPAVELDSTLFEDNSNLFTNPEFGPNFYLNSTSSCLNGGRDGLLIGALGNIPESRPTLNP